MFISLVILLHVIVCFILIVSVLLQSGKGADLAGAFGGGGSQTAFGSRGPATFLSRLTTFAAITFMVTSLALSMFFTAQPSIISNLPTEDPGVETPVATPPETPAVPSQTPGTTGGETSPPAGGGTAPPPTVPEPQR